MLYSVLLNIDETHFSITLDFDDSNTNMYLWTPDLMNGQTIVPKAWDNKKKKNSKL